MRWINFVFVLLAFVFFVGCTQPQTIVVDKENTKDLNSLVVQGVAEFDTAPDEAIISFAVETQDLDVKAAQDENRKISDEVMQALSSKGIGHDKIETSYYNIQKIREWDHETRKQVDKGFRVTNRIKVTVDELDKVGEVLDAIVKAGANRVDGVDFGLSDKKKTEVKSEALRIAAKNAKTKAESLAVGAGVTLGKVLSIQEIAYDIYPIRAYAKEAVMAGEMDENFPSTQINPEQVHVNVKVKVVYAI
ncbi:hypothetical protein DRJ25_00540 [Candidatus Woesearchaeota archaeon]|nr:MAG: hypothetical protein DRJ25_00540 [Candidatus Woesearchaeota archaeon]